jgi:hypothetical protein
MDHRPVEVDDKSRGRIMVSIGEVLLDLEQKHKLAARLHVCHGECGFNSFHGRRHSACDYAPVGGVLLEATA